MTSLTRRDLFPVAAALPAAGLFSRHRGLAALSVNRVKLTNIRAMAIRNVSGLQANLAPGEEYSG